MAAGASGSGVIADDAALLRATRDGDATAFGRLYERHAGAALVVARQYTDSAADAEDVVSDAFANVHRALLGGGGPESAFRAYLFTVVRRVAAVHRTAGRRAEPTDDVATLETASTPVETAEEPTLAGFERSVVARAFRSLPERWQEVLWHSEVEGLTPAQIAPIIGLTANSTAALAYRAREGLRQAYLQQHLQDPLDEGCRAVAGKLGAHVRGGLGARDTRAVEAHLDECGECRALVLELGDVNHGMRGVVAPLVLGLLGLGALAHELPVGGGIVAGATALAAGGAASGAASGTGGATVGAAAGGAGGATGGVAGAGVLAGMSAGVVAAAVAAVVVVAAAIVGAVQLLSGPDDVAASPTSEVAGASQSASAEAADEGVDASSPAPVPPVTAPSVAATPTPPGADPTPARVRPRATPAPSPSAVVAAPTAAPSPETPAEPTQSPTAPPAPADVVVAAPEGGIALTAGLGGQSIALSVSNEGGLPAAGVVAQVELPLGVTFLAEVVTGGGFGFGPADTSAWTCLTGDEGRTATCTLQELGPGQDATLVLDVVVDESYQASGDESLRVRVLADGRTWEPAPITFRVAASPARLAFAEGVPAEVQLVAGRARELVLPLRNAGGTATAPGAPAVVALELPRGVTARAAAPWSCTRAAGTSTCVHPGLDAFERTTLAVAVEASEATLGSGVVHLRLSPASHRPAETHDVAYSVVRPAVMTVEAPPALDVAAATRTPVAVTVGNAGDLPADVTLTLTGPTAARVVDAGGDGWACAADGSATTCTATLAPGARSNVAAAVEVDAGAVGALGAVTVAVAAPDADVPATPHQIVLTGVEPLLTLTDTTAVVDGTRGGTVTFAAGAAGTRDDGRAAAGAVGVVATVTLPPGVTLDGGAVTPQTVCDGTGRVVTCPLGDLAPGEVRPVQLAVRAPAAVRGSVDVRLTAPGAAPVTSSAPIVVPSGNLTPVWSGVGDLDVVEVGAPLLVCVDPYGATCVAVDRDRDNNGLDMRPIDQAAPGGSRADVPVSSGTRLDVPAGRPIVWAGLYWSAVRAPADRWSAPLDTARLRAPDGTWADVRAGSVTQVTDRSGRQYYQAAVDVTELVARGGAGTWALADAAVSAGRTDRDPSYYAGWSLVVVHGTIAPDAADASAVTVHQGGSWIGTASTAPAFVFVGEAGTPTRIGVVAWEGDRGTTQDRLALSDVGPLTPLRWDGSAVVRGGSAANAFDSTATGWEHTNSLGVDAKAFEEVTLPTGVGALTPSTVGDQYLIGVVTVRTGAPPLLEASAS